MLIINIIKMWNKFIRQNLLLYRSLQNVTHVTLIKNNKTNYMKKFRKYGLNIIIQKQQLIINLHAISYLLIKRLVCFMMSAELTNILWIYVGIHWTCKKFLYYHFISLSHIIPNVMTVFFNIFFSSSSGDYSLKINIS